MKLFSLLLYLHLLHPLYQSTISICMLFIFITILLLTFPTFKLSNPSPFNTLLHTNLHISETSHHSQYSQQSHFKIQNPQLDPICSNPNHTKHQHLFLSQSLRLLSVDDYVIIYDLVVQPCSSLFLFGGTQSLSLQNLNLINSSTPVPSQTSVLELDLTLYYWWCRLYGN